MIVFTESNLLCLSLDGLTAVLYALNALDSESFENTVLTRGEQSLEHVESIETTVSNDSKLLQPFDFFKTVFFPSSIKSLETIVVNSFEAIVIVIQLQKSRALQSWVDLYATTD